MNSSAYTQRRSELETYFDRTASDAWAKLTSDAPVSGIRATVRAGRDAMRSQLLAWLPEDLSGKRVLDAGCGPGQLSIEAARRGAEVVGVDLSPTLLDHARQRIAQEAFPGSVELIPGDMLSSASGQFDHVVAMDSLIHYPSKEIVEALARLAAQARHSVVFTVAPRTMLLTMMHAAGSLFPRGDKAPAIEPVSERVIRKGVATHPGLAEWTFCRTEKVSSGFYFSQAMEIVRK